MTLRLVEVDGQMPLPLLVAVGATLAHQIVEALDFGPLMIEAQPAQPGGCRP